MTRDPRASAHLRLAALALALVVSAGCISEDYPASWPPLAPAAAEFPSIAGRYRNEGERGSPDSPPATITLTGFLFPLLEDSVAVDTVEILEPEPGVIEVRASNKGEEVAVRRLSAEHDDFTCSDGRVETSTSRWVADNFTGKEWSSYDYSKAVDGSLMLEHTSSGFAVILLIIPLGGSESWWYRFPPCAEE